MSLCCMLVSLFTTSANKMAAIDLVCMILLTVLLGGIILAVVTFWAWRGTRVRPSEEDGASGEFVGGTSPGVSSDAPTFGAPPDGKLGEGLSSASKQEPSGVGPPAADHPPMTPLPDDKDEFLPIGTAQSNLVISPRITTTTNIGHQPTLSEPLSTEERFETLKPVNRDLFLRRTGIFAQKVNGVSNHLVLLRRFVSKHAWEKGRALLEGLGLSGAQIAKCYGMHPLNEEESVQHGLQVWLDGGTNTTWQALLKAMETAEIAVQQQEGLKEKLCSNTGLAIWELKGEGPAQTTGNKSLRAKLGCYYNKECIQDNPLLVSSTMQYIKVNLVQTKQRRPVAGRVKEEVAVHLAKGGVQQVPHEKVPLEYQNILAFTPPTGIIRQRVIIEGVAGSGKSTLVHRMCRDYSVGRFARDYEAVIQVTLRSLSKHQKLSLEDLIFTSVGDADIVEEVTAYITACRGKAVLFIFDGFDELSEEMRENSLVRDIIKGHILPQSSFVVTTRPISAVSLYHCVDRRVEISGFGEEEVKNCITEYFASSNPTAGEKLLSTLSLRPDIKRLCYVPLLLLMVCYIVSIDGDSAELPHTLHQLFEYLILLTVNHNLERAGRKERTGSLQDVRRLCPNFDKLTQLALAGIEKDTIIFSDLDFEVGSALHGLFNAIEACNHTRVVSRTWHFLHLAVQEFMAALEVLKKTPEEQVTFWNHHLNLTYNRRGDFVFTQDRYHTLFLFYSGMSSLSTPGIQNMLLDTLNTVMRPSIRSTTPLPALCEAVAESDNEQLVGFILSPCGPTVEIDRYYLNNVGVAWCVGEYCKQVDGAGIKIDGGYGVANFISQLGDIFTLGKVELPCLDEVDDLPTVKQFLLKQAQLKCVKFGQLMGTNDVIDTVKDVLTHHKESLEEVTLHERKMGLDPLGSLVDSLVTCQRLTSLKLECVTLSLQRFLTIVKGLYNLRALELDDVSLSTETPLTASDVHLIVSSMEHHPSLKELTVGGECNESVVQGAVEGMTRRHGVEKLVVTARIRVAPTLVPPICALVRSGSVKTLGIGEDFKPDQIVQVLEELPHSTHLRELKLKLSLSDEVITLPSAVEAGLSQCTALQKLTVRGNSPSVTAALLKTVTMIRSLEEVTLDWCDYGGVDKKVANFLSNLKEAKQLRKVLLTHCRNLSPSLVATICGGLCSNNSMEEVIVALEIGKMKVQGEDVTDPDALKAVETAVRRNTSLRRIKIDGSYLKWANVATAILKGAAQTQSLRRLELMTPEDFPPHQEVVDDVRRANPKLQLFVWALGHFL